MIDSPKCQALILKVASRCNLNCTYCYMYNLGDNTYLKQPKFMSDELVDVLLRKVQNHCLKHRLKYFEFIFHGGEPLLMKEEFYRNFVKKAKTALAPTTKPLFSLQTNGVLLTESWCKLFGELNIYLGISLDGTPEVNDKFRIDHHSKGAYDLIINGLKIAQSSKFLISKPNLLCVIDVFSDPLEVYRHFKVLSVNKISFLLPYSTHDNPPPGLVDRETSTPYADWLLSIFDEWFDEQGPKPSIRLFEQIIELIIGIDRGFEYMGRRNLEFLVIETDGSIEAVGALKVCGNGFTKAGINIKNNELDHAFNTELAQLYHLSHEKLPTLCKGCPIINICGGGFLPHRYKKMNGFDNPSIFCADLMKLISRIQNKIVDLLPNTDTKARIDLLSFNELKESLQKRRARISVL
jgi:uncharacterized protein